MFSEIELKRIDSAVGDLCRRKSPAHIRSQLEFVFVVDKHNVSIYEVRPGWKNPAEKTRHGVARFKFNRATGKWSLYWLRRDLKWHRYAPDGPLEGELAMLVRLVEEDKLCAFFG